MPTNPTTPPNGTYTSTCDSDSSWDGSFTYNNGAISYTRNTTPTGPFSATNQDNGNAMNFTIDDGTETMHFVAQTFEWKDGDKAKYKGTCNVEGPTAGENGWTATQS